MPENVCDVSHPGSVTFILDPWRLYIISIPVFTSIPYNSSSAFYIFRKLLYTSNLPIFLTTNVSHSFDMSNIYINFSYISVYISSILTNVQQLRVNPTCPLLQASQQFQANYQKYYNKGRKYTLELIMENIWVSRSLHFSGKLPLSSSIIQIGIYFLFTRLMERSYDFFNTITW